MLRLRKASPDAIGLFLLPDQIKPFLKQMKEQQINPVILGADTLTDPSVLNESSSLVQEAIFSDIDIPKSFLDFYLREYKTTNNGGFAVNSYFFTKLIFKLLKNNSLDTSANIIKALNSVKNEKECNYCSYYSDSEYGQYFNMHVVAKVIKGEFWEVVNKDK